MDIDQLATTASTAIKKTDPATLRKVADVCFMSGFASIAASIVVWGIKKGTDSDAKSERMGIFIGLWAPTFFILSNRFERYAERAESGKLIN